MTGQPAPPRYQMVNVHNGYVIIEKEVGGHAARAYFSTEPVPPKEEYREGSRIWKYGGMAQSFQFDVLDRETGTVTPFREMLGLMYYGCARPGTDLRRLGELAHEDRISVYVALAYENPDGSPRQMPVEKLSILNRAFNERLRSAEKKILIVPDCFGLYNELSHGEIMIDFGLTAMEEEA